MKKVFFLVVILVYTSLVFSQIKIKKANTNIAHSKKPLIPHYDCIDLNSISINGKIQWLDDAKKIKKTLGKPDSIAPDRGECCTYFDEEDTKIYWYGKTSFEVYKDTAVFEDINVEDGKFFVEMPKNKILLNRNTTFSEVQKAFPFSCKQVFDRGVYGDKTKRMYRCIDLQTDPKAEDIVTLYFYKGKFISIEYSFPD